VRLVRAEEVVEDRVSDLVPGLGQPLVPHLVGEDAEGAQEARPRLERVGRLAILRHRRHVDPALEPGRAAEGDGPDAADRLADPLDVVAPVEVEGGGVARPEVEVREDHEEVVGVRVRLVEAQADAGAGLDVQRAVGQAVVVVGAVVLDDRDLAGVAVDRGVRQGRERGPGRAQALRGLAQLLGRLGAEGRREQGEE
jgi:hypothetical protein